MNVMFMDIVQLSELIVAITTHTPSVIIVQFTDHQSHTYYVYSRLFIIAILYLLMYYIIVAYT